MSDTTVLLVKRKAHRIHQVKRAADLIESRQGRLLGVALVQSRFPSAGFLERYSPTLTSGSRRSA